MPIWTKTPVVPEARRYTWYFFTPPPVSESGFAYGAFQSRRTEVPTFVIRSEFAHIASPLMISNVAQSAWLHSVAVRPGLQRVASEFAIASATVVPGPQRESRD